MFNKKQVVLAVIKIQKYLFLKGARSEIVSTLIAFDGSRHADEGEGVTRCLITFKVKLGFSEVSKAQINNHQTQRMW